MLDILQYQLRHLQQQRKDRFAQDESLPITKNPQIALREMLLPRACVGLFRCGCFAGFPFHDFESVNSNKYLSHTLSLAWKPGKSKNGCKQFELYSDFVLL
jgi:hypothetical protein